MKPVEVRAPRGAVRLEIVWEDGSLTGFEHVVLRAFCPCAHCQGHQGPISWRPEAEAGGVLTELDDLFEIGRYALGLSWADGHSTGIYTHRFLRALAAAEDQPRDAQRALTFER